MPRDLTGSDVDSDDRTRHSGPQVCKTLVSTLQTSLLWVWRQQLCRFTSWSLLAKVRLLKRWCRALLGMPMPREQYTAVLPNVETRATQVAQAGRAAEPSMKG